MNYIKKVAELLNVEVGEYFTIHFKKEKRQIKNFYLNEEKGLMIKTGGSDVKANSSFVEGILTGTFCGGKMFWYEKDLPMVTFQDIRAGVGELFVVKGKKHG